MTPFRVACEVPARCGWPARDCMRPFTTLRPTRTGRRRRRPPRRWAAPYLRRGAGARRPETTPGRSDLHRTRAGAPAPTRGRGGRSPRPSPRRPRRPRAQQVAEGAISQSGVQDRQRQRTLAAGHRVPHPRMLGRLREGNHRGVRVVHDIPAVSVEAVPAALLAPPHAFHQRLEVVGHALVAEAVGVRARRPVMGDLVGDRREERARPVPMDLQDETRRRLGAPVVGDLDQIHALRAHHPGAEPVRQGRSREGCRLRGGVGPILVTGEVMGGEVPAGAPLPVPPGHQQQPLPPAVPAPEAGRSRGRRLSARTRHGGPPAVGAADGGHKRRRRGGAMDTGKRRRAEHRVPQHFGPQHGHVPLHGVVDIRQHLAVADERPGIGQPQPPLLPGCHRLRELDVDDVDLLRGTAGDGVQALPPGDPRAGGGDAEQPVEDEARAADRLRGQVAQAQRAGAADVARRVGDRHRDRARDQFDGEAVAGDLAGWRHRPHLPQARQAENGLDATAFAVAHKDACGDAPAPSDRPPPHAVDLNRLGSQSESAGT